MENYGLSKEVSDKTARGFQKGSGIDIHALWIGNDHNGVIIPSKVLTERFFFGVPLTHELEVHEALFANLKIHEVLGFKE